MIGSRGWLVALAGFLTIGAGPASPPAPNGSDTDPATYQLRLPVALGGNAPVQRLKLTGQALIASQSANSLDVRVFDGNGRIVPIARMPTLPSPSRAILLPALPILGSSKGADDTGISLKVDDQGRVRTISVDAQTATDDAATKVVGSFFDTRGQTGNAERLVLTANIPAGQPITFVIEASEDLKSWRPFGEAVAYRSPSEASQTRDEAITLRGSLLGNTQLRVMWRSDSRLLAPVAISNAVLVLGSSSGGETKIIAAKAPPLLDNYSLEFAAPFATPIHAIAIDARGGEGLLPVKILARNNNEEPWVQIGEGSAQLNSSLIPLRGQPTAAIRIEADRRTSGFTAPPELRLGIVSHEIAFVASGTPPFTFATGKSSARDVFLPLDSITQVPPASIPEASIADSPVGALALTPVGEGGASRRSLVLWAILLAVTALLAGIAWHLWSRRPAQA